QSPFRLTVRIEFFECKEKDEEGKPVTDVTTWLSIIPDANNRCYRIKQVGLVHRAKNPKLTLPCPQPVLPSPPMASGGEIATTSVSYVSPNDPFSTGMSPR